MQVIYPQLDGVKIHEDRTLPIALLQAIRKVYDYVAQVAQVDLVLPVVGNVPRVSGMTTLGTSSITDDGLGHVGISNTTPTVPLDVTGDVNVTGVYMVAGIQVVAAQGAALTAALAYGGGIFGGTYTGVEQTLANALVTQVINLKARVDQLEARLVAHGLIV